MTRKTKKYILIALLVTLVGAVAVGYMMWNKPHRSVETADAIKVTALDLHDTYKKDSVTAKKQYTDKVVEVSGTVMKQSTNQQNEAIVLLKTNEDGAFVNCTLEGKTDAVKEGDAIRLKGICSGYSGGDADLGLPGDVVLVRCYIIK